MREAKPVLCLILAAVLLLSLAACQKAEELPEGYYVLSGNQAETTYGQTPFLLFREDGTAVLFNGTELWDCSWLHGQLKLMGGGTMEYTVAENNLALGTGDGILHFKKSGEPVPDLKKLKEDLSLPAETGYYKMTKIIFKEDSVTMTAEELESEWYLALYEDGTAVSCMVGELCSDLLWKDGKLTDPEGQEEPVRYTLEGEKLIMEDSAMTSCFTRISRTAPEPETLHEMGLPAEVGYYTAVSLTLDGMTLTEKELENIYEVMPFLLLQEGGSAVFYSGTGLTEMQWDEDSLCDSYTVIPYELEGDTLTVSEENNSMVFRRSQEDVPDLDSLPVIGQNLTGDYELYSGDLGEGERYDVQADLSLYKDGTGLYTTRETTLNCSWSESSIVIGNVEYSYELNENGWLVLIGEDGTFTFRMVSAETEDMDLWNNDWYGWWVIKDCTGDLEDMEGAWWDMCARSTVDENGSGTMVLWDEEFNSPENALGEVTFTLTDGDQFSSESGRLYLHQIGAGDWTFNPANATYPNMIEFTARATTESGDFTYMIYLRPWGSLWDDVDEFYVPYYYEDWYLPQIQNGDPMPETMIVNK